MEIKKTIKFGDNELTLQTGVIARQASGAVLADMNGTTVLATVVGAQSDEDDDRSFFPLRVDYQEKSYASGKIPGGFFKREGRPSERETLTARLIDRPIRPLFPNKFKSEVQIIATVVSFNPDVSPDIVAIIASSAALAISGIPFQGPLAASKVGYKDGSYILNPSDKQLKDSELDLVVAGTKDSVLMVESEAKILPEDVMLGAVMFGQEQFQPVLTGIEDLAKEVAKTPWDWQAKQDPEDVVNAITNQFKSRIDEAYKTTDKLERKSKLASIKEEAKSNFVSEENNISDTLVGNIIGSLESEIVRGRIINNEPRIDGRDTKTVRPINVKTGVLSRTHGSALFTRGETQALVAITLGSAKDAQINDSISGEERDTFMLHYNFPPYSVNEIGMVGSPKRREIGHGKLAKRGVAAVVPSEADFPYVIRSVSEITESNGSSSMASVCGTSLALMDAGVPVSAPVAGIAMGLIKEEDKFAVITDILGDEDHLGDMDFKVAGSKEGITALQMDIKIPGITKEIMQVALDQAKDGRLHILDIMNKEISEPKVEVSEHAPRIQSFKVDPDKIKDIIGKGGATIKGLIEETGVAIDIDEKGNVKLASSDKAALELAQSRIEDIVAEVEVGAIYEGTVNKITDFGAFVTVLPGKDGLLHISQIAHHRVANVSDELQEGQKVRVKVTEIDRQGRIKLSKKVLEQSSEGSSE